MQHVTTKLSKSIGSRRRIPSGLDKINLNIFKNAETECQRPVGSALVTDSCSAVERLCFASRYWSVLNAAEVDEEERRALFVEFNEEVYHFIVDDAAHFVRAHSADLEQVWSEWTLNYGFARCTVSDCAQTERHYGRGRRERTKETKGADNEHDAVYSFYEALYDRVHNLIAHLFDIGLRVDESTLLEEVGGNGEDEDMEGLSVDKLFEAERDRIRSRRKQCNLELDRLDDENNKFTIQSAKGTEGGITLMDALFRGLVENKKMSNEALYHLKAYFVQNGYDTDGVEADLQKLSESNICRLLKEQVAAEWMSTFIRIKNCMHSLAELIVICFHFRVHALSC